MKSYTNVDFSSSAGHDLLTDESLIDYLFPDEIVELFYQSEAFKDDRIDFGGGVSGITCRSVMVACDSKPEKLVQILGLKKNRQELNLCKLIVAECQKQLDLNAYLF